MGNGPLVREFCSAAMREAAAIGARIGCEVTQTPDDRHAITRKLGAFKSSMQHDVEAGRPIQLDSIVSAVQQIGAPRRRAERRTSTRCSASRECPGACGGCIQSHRRARRPAVHLLEPQSDRLAL